MSCASAQPPPPTTATQPSAASAPVTLAQPAVVPPAAAGKAPQPWAWRSAPRFNKCSPGVVAVDNAARYCLTLADGVDFLHWQQEQKSDAEKAVEAAMGRFREEQGRREALESGSGVSLGQVLGITAGILGALGVGLFAGWLWGHFGTPRNGLEVTRPVERGLEPLQGVLLPQP